VHIRPGGDKFVVSRDAKGLDDLIERLKSVPVVAIGVEATGGFEQVVTATLAGAGLPVVVVNPAQVRAFARALGQRAKTDPIDAGVIHILLRQQGRKFVLCRMSRPGSWLNW